MKRLAVRLATITALSACVAFAALAASLLMALPAAAGPFAYVANEDSDDVSIVDVGRATEVARLPVVDKPKGVDTNRAHTRLVVANDQYLSVFDLTDLSRPRVDIDLRIGGATDVVVDPSSERAWVSHKHWYELSEVNLNTRQVVQFHSSLANVRHLAISSATHQVYGVSAAGSVMQMSTVGFSQARKVAHEIAPSPTDLFVGDSGDVLVGSLANGNVLSFAEPAPGAMASHSVVDQGYNPGGLSAHLAGSSWTGPIVARPDDDVIETGAGQIAVAPNAEPTWVRIADREEFLLITLENDPSGVSPAGDGSLLILTPFGDSYAPLGNDPRDLEVRERLGARSHTTPSELKFGTRAAFGARRLTVTVRSVGDEPLSISRFRFYGPDAGDFRIVAQDCTGSALDFQDACRVTIGFSPSPKICAPNPWLKHPICVPSYSADLEIESNAEFSTYLVALRGGLFAKPTPIQLKPGVGPRILRLSN